MVRRNPKTLAQVEREPDRPGEPMGALATVGETSTEELLRRYRRRGSTALRDCVVERHRELVEGMARGLAARLPRSVDAQDLLHAGLWGLLQAIACYEPSRCDQFTAFLRIRVRGAMLDELRHLDYLPRLWRRRRRERDAAITRLRASLEREPTDAEVAAELGVTPAELWRRFAGGTRVTQGALPAHGDGEFHDLVEALPDDAAESPVDSLTRRELIERIRDCLEPTEWRVLQLHYLEGMTGKQVARRLRLSASRICQIHGRVLDRLKARLADVAV